MMEVSKIFRDGELVRALISEIKEEIESLDHKPIYIMDFCGGHTQVIVREGIDQLLEGYIKFVHGPGCPVCVIPKERVDLAIELARNGVILCTYGDLLRVPGSDGISLLHAKAEGYDVRMIYSCLDTIKIAQNNPDKEVVFFAIGFETTTPHTASLILKSKEMGIKNLSVVSNHVVTPAGIQHILNSIEMREYGKVKIDAFLGPGHVSAIIGTKPYEYFVEEFRKPVAISGFEPVDILLATQGIIRQLRTRDYKVQNYYQRVVTREGNKKAQELVARVFELRKWFTWRGLGVIPYSGLKIKKEYKDYDAESRFRIEVSSSREANGCICGAVLRGIREPIHCTLFGKECTPENPMGSCMVSSEGTCHAYYIYRYGG